ncbi:MAG: helical backbone metal receptor, partial [Rubricoccaceae bacterium]|nr:helical backbone metal receptor [Rubricoccaceae bacterium]
MRRTSLLPLLFATVVLFGCRQETTADNDQRETTLVTDGMGRELELEVPAHRVLALAPNLTEIIYAIGAGDRLVAVSQADNFPQEVDDLPRFSSFPLNHEQVVGFQPDLLLATEGVNSPTDAEALAEVNVPTYFLSFERISDIPEAMRGIGDLLGVDGAAVAAAFDAEVDSLRKRTADLTRPTVLLLIDDVGLYAFGRDSYASEAIRLAGAENLTDEFDGQAAVPSAEFVLDRAPDFIVLLSGDDDYSAADLLAKQPAWEAIPAIRNDQVFSVHPDLLARPGPRLLDGIQHVIRHI